MVIKREEAAGYVSKEMQAKLAELEATIDKQLREQWFPGHTVTISFSASLGVKKRWYTEEICRRYREAGWGAEFHHATDQRDSDYFKFS